MRQAIGSKTLAKINAKTRQTYVRAWNRGGSAWWLCELESSDGRLNADYVNRATWEVVPIWRDGRDTGVTTATL